METPDEQAVRKSAARLYGEGQIIWHADDAWNSYKRQQIDGYAERWLAGRSIAQTLDIGSGIEGYDWIADDAVRLDRFAEQVMRYRLGVAADAERLPFPDRQFNQVVCVGSVLNYVSAIECLSEIARVTAPRGLLLLHYESSSSAEHLGTDRWRANAARLSTINASRCDDIWIYRPTFISGVLRGLGFTLLRSARFHIASAMALRIGVSQQRAAGWARLDGVMAPLSALADDVILLAGKT